MRGPSNSSSGAVVHPGRVAPRRVWAAWAATVFATVLSLMLWIVQAVVRAVPGPIVSGVYVDDAIDTFIVVAYVATGIALATIAAVLISHVPDNIIGWILGGVAAWHAATFMLSMSLSFLQAPGTTPTVFANWLGSWTFVIPASASLVLILFPTGSLPSPRWRPLGWLALLGVVAAWAILEATDHHLGTDASMPNPFASASVNTVADVASDALGPTLIGTIASLVIRYRRSSRDVRLQIKWVAYGGFLAILLWTFVWGWSVARPETFDARAVSVGTVALLITPSALAVAILKRRLYDIDRLVSRTVSYTVLAVVLAGGFALGVIGLQTLFRSPGRFAVAVTTLAIAAVFDPLRRRLRDLIDQRFNRRHFDAALVMETFAARVVTVSDLDELTACLRGVLQPTLAPSSVDLWIRE